MSIHRVTSITDCPVPDEAVVIADRSLPASLRDGWPDPILVEAGEGLKTMEAVEDLARRVLQRRASRPLTIVAVGGGSVGDAVGFLASILWRGVALWHVPTTCLAMVDSAHGGKTAVNLDDAKNQLGTFYEADRVYLVEDALSELPLEQRRDGLAELVKALWLGDAETLDRLDGTADSTTGFDDPGIETLAAAPFDSDADASIGADLIDLIERAIRVKQGIVERDPREQHGIRTYLNLGHTVAHALELHTEISHGHAVAWGLAAASFASSTYADLTDDEAARLRKHVHPLLTPLRDVCDFHDRAAFIDAVGRDKKTQEGTLRSVVLDGPGSPRVTKDIDAQRWFDAFRRSVEWFLSTPIEAVRDRRVSGMPDLASSKSEMNRARVIAHLREAPTDVHGQSRADDVAHLEEALATFSQTQDPTTVYAGEGGTTFRFLLAIAATRQGDTTILADDPLLERPHEPLLEALRYGGAETSPAMADGRAGVAVTGWHRFPEQLRVDASESSQYASALALLAATGESFTLEITSDEIASRPYFDMTLSMLRRAGVSVTEDDDRDIFEFGPGPRLQEALDLHVAPDASSAAVWLALTVLEDASGPGIDSEGFKREGSGREEAMLQPDRRMRAFASRLRSHRDDANAELEFTLADAPDLAPVLTAVATQISPAIRITGAAHLRHKESDRIHDLVEGFDGVGIDVEPRQDGFHVPAGRQPVDRGARWKPSGDHRLVMAGLLLTHRGAPLVFNDPMVISKSYPDFWHHARFKGWATQPVESSTPLSESGSAT
jgi:3-phosphoshikimate 1-carboxyvinyltransferase